MAALYNVFKLGDVLQIDKFKPPFHVDIECRVSIMYLIYLHGVKLYHPSSKAIYSTSKVVKWTGFPSENHFANNVKEQTELPKPNELFKDFTVLGNKKKEFFKGLLDVRSNFMYS